MVILYQTKKQKIIYKITLIGCARYIERVSALYRVSHYILGTLGAILSMEIVIGYP